MAYGPRGHIIWPLVLVLGPKLTHTLEQGWTSPSHRAQSMRPMPWPLQGLHCTWHPCRASLGLPPHAKASACCTSSGQSRTMPHAAPTLTSLGHKPHMAPDPARPGQEPQAAKILEWWHKKCSHGLATWCWIPHLPGPVLALAGLGLCHTGCPLKLVLHGTQCLPQTSCSRHHVQLASWNGLIRHHGCWTQHGVGVGYSIGLIRPTGLALCCSSALWTGPVPLIWPVGPDMFEIPAIGYLYPLRSS